MRPRYWLQCLLVVFLVTVVSCSDGNPPGPTPALENTSQEATAGDTPIASAPSSSGVAVKLVFGTEAVEVGQDVAATVSVEGVEDLFGIEVHLTFDADLLQVVDADPETDGVQVDAGDLLEVGYTVLNQADNDAGSIDYAVSQMPPSTGATGGGPVLRIQFRAAAAGEARLQIGSLVLADSQGAAIPADADQAAADISIE